MKAMPGDRVRVHIKHEYGGADGRWGTVVERTTKRLTLVMFDEDKARGKRTQTHDADVVEVEPLLPRCGRCNGLRRVYTSEGTADCPCSPPTGGGDPSGQVHE